MLFSQSRVVVNPGLEFGVGNGAVAMNDGNFGFGPSFDAGASVMSPWYTSHSTVAGVCNPGFSGNCHPIEVWGTGFLNVPAAQGTNFVELNAYESSMIYQNIYLATDDVITYYFRHRARALTTERAAMVIENQNQTNIATIRNTAATSSTTSWSVNQGTYTFTGVSGVYRVGFRALVSGGNPGLGNLLDDIRVTLNPLIDLKFTSALSSCEGSSNGNLFLRINGAVKSPTRVAVELINPGNGTQFITDSDIAVTGIPNSNGTPTVSHVAGSNIYLITIPTGNYDGGSTLGYANPNNDEDGIGLNITSVNDGIQEPNETFKFEIKEQGTNGSTNNFVSTSSPIFGDTYYPTTNDYFILQCVCYNDANTSATGTESKHGITLLERAGAENGNWPMIRKSAHTVLESNTKGFVITRMTSAQINAIISPQEGMMTYDTNLKCLKVYNGTEWSCFNTPTCP
ncbi:hypothetical protein [Chryseobacterium echinoideorum]|uniref:hypothetical protein n=1 Tax=Chryseobacterium echinoideorum TaxID=1549648 RepID=UPI00118485DA|nr:hypothetical protein [Chryseobacterium echinoideorum]